MFLDKGLKHETILAHCHNFWLNKHVKLVFLYLFKFLKLSAASEMLTQLLNLSFLIQHSNPLAEKNTFIMRAMEFQRENRFGTSHQRYGTGDYCTVLDQ